jgi:hypothetical protein
LIVVAVTSSTIAFRVGFPVFVSVTKSPFWKPLVEPTVIERLSAA